jgi:transcriptional regulator with XRE-family HTH domain
VAGALTTRPSRADSQCVAGMNEVLVPPRRLGALLRESRVAAGEELADVAARSDRFTVVDLDDLEHGRRPLDDSLLREVVEIYGVDCDDVIPQRSRLMIDLDEGLISVDATHERVQENPEPDEVLIRYLALVHRLRGQPVGTAIGIRELDIAVLASALELDDAEIERRLRRLLGDPEPVEASERALRRRLLVPLAGVVVATTAIGVLVLISDDISDTDPNRILVQVPPETQVGDAAIVERTEIVEGSESGPPAGTGEVETDIGDAAVVERGAPPSTPN